MKRNRFVYLALAAMSAAIIAGSCQSENELNYARYYTSGKTLYDQYCQNCHATDGQGLGKLIPPLTDTLYMVKNKDRLACIIKNGMNEEIEVHGIRYSTAMPANKQLADMDVAALVTYITNSFGNKQGLYTVGEATRHLSECP